MKKTSFFKPVFFFPALIILSGMAELFFLYFFEIRETKYGFGFVNFLINLLYGIAIGQFYIFLNEKPEKRTFHVAEFLSLFLPAVIIGAFLLFWRYTRPSIMDIVGMTYPNYADIFNVERFPEHLLYVYLGFLMLFVFRKGSEEKKRIEWITCACSSAFMALFFLVTEILTEKIFGYAFSHPNFNLFPYEGVFLALNLLFGIILGALTVLIGNRTVKDKRQNHGCNVGFILCLLLGLVPFLYICISYHTSFTMPYNKPYYQYLQFGRQSDFFQLFQILSGYLFVYCLSKNMKKRNNG